MTASTELICFLVWPLPETARVMLAVLGAVLGVSMPLLVLKFGVGECVEGGVVGVVGVDGGVAGVGVACTYGAGVVSVVGVGVGVRIGIEHGVGGVLC